MIEKTQRVYEYLVTGFEPAPPRHLQREAPPTAQDIEDYLEERRSKDDPWPADDPRHG